MKICPVGAELLVVPCGQKGMMKLTVALHRFVNAPKKAVLKLTPELLVTCKIISVSLNNPVSGNELYRNKINQSVLMHRDVQRTE
jgi:hypothetical protein